jgi:hypothetical protein
MGEAEEGVPNAKNHDACENIQTREKDQVKA